VTGPILVTGWFSFADGEITAGDLLALTAVLDALRAAGHTAEVAWSPHFRPESLQLADADPDRYSHLLFVCGPVSGPQVAALHDRFPRCRRIAVGVSVIDRGDPASAGFDLILARDGPGSVPQRDLAAAVRLDRGQPPLPVVGVSLTTGQGEYGPRRRHEPVAARLTSWLKTKPCAPVVLETRLDRRDWRLCSTEYALTALIGKLDLVLTMRLHGLALALRAGIPALAVDPVAGGGKVTAQARAWQWPAIVAAEQTADPGRLDRWWDWCTSAPGRDRAAQAATVSHSDTLLADLVGALA
jgi:hypothetical protein